MIFDLTRRALLTAALSTALDSPATLEPAAILASREPTITDRDFTIATIAAPTVVAEETASEGDEEGEEGEEGDDAATEDSTEDDSQE